VSLPLGSFAVPRPLQCGHLTETISGLPGGRSNGLPITVSPLWCATQPAYTAATQRAIAKALRPELFSGCSRAYL